MKHYFYEHSPFLREPLDLRSLPPRSKPVGKSERSIDPKTRHDLATALPARKPVNFRLRRAAPPASENDEITDVEDENLAALSGSRYSSRRKPPGARSQHSAGLSVVTIVLGSPGKPAASEASRLDSPAKVRVFSSGRSVSPTVRVHPSTCCCRSQTMEIYLASRAIKLAGSQDTEIA